METCEHVESLKLASNNSVLDPSRWKCSKCGNTEWVWACFSCPHVACGRLNQQHALEHFEKTKHPLAIEVNENYVYCYQCDQYITGDSKSGVLESVRSALTAIGTLSLEELQHATQVGKLLRSYSLKKQLYRNRDTLNDRQLTADLHYRKTVLSKLFCAWQAYVHLTKKQKEEPQVPRVTRAYAAHIKKPTLIPGVTGLRNLGNTCYINSIIQALGHLDEFREYFSNLMVGLFSPPSHTDASGQNLTGKTLLRLNTVDYFQHISSKVKGNIAQQASSGKNMNPGGLHGGGTGKIDEQVLKSQVLQTLSLCQELHGLLRVLWSGKWAQVSPHGFLNSLWKAIPMFRGHSQHDAQEFLCELLDKVSQEIDHLPQLSGSENIVDQSFRGELVSQVTCQQCNNVSKRQEPFLDLSLEFPHSFASTYQTSECHVTEMLDAFTSEEDLEPLSYHCEQCNANSSRPRRQSQSPVKTNAKKQLLISQAPDILRLHLKRFRWSGRNHREKIGTHVNFDQTLDLSPYCCSGDVGCTYRLNAVVVHHGSGFRSGHYTAFTYNTQAESWLHCNDLDIWPVTLDQVLASQAYILFYSKQTLSVDWGDMPSSTLHSSQQTNSTDVLSNTTSIAELDPETVQTLRRGDTLQALDEEVSFSFHRDQILVRRLSTISNGDGETSQNDQELLNRLSSGSNKDKESKQNDQNLARRLSLRSNIDWGSKQNDQSLLRRLSLRSNSDRQSKQTDQILRRLSPSSNIDRVPKQNDQNLVRRLSGRIYHNSETKRKLHSHDKRNSSQKMPRRKSPSL